MNRRRVTSLSRAAFPFASQRGPPAVPAGSVVSSTPSLASSAKQGFGWGLGNAVAQTLMNSAFSKPVVADSSLSLTNEYKQCRKDVEDKEACKHLLK